MAWRGSGSHLDANVPDYQKVIQGRSSSTGWSSTQSSIPSYSSRFPGAYGHPGSYMSPRNHSALRSGGYNNPYQPSKYGVGSEPSLNTQATTNFRNVAPDGYNTDSDYMDRTYGFRGREFDLEPYRSPSHRITDYSSDSGRGHASHRTTDYSSDSGTSYRKSVKSNSDFELEIPSPETSRSQSRSQNDDTVYSSPVKSNIPVSDYYNRLSKNHMEEGGLSNRSNHLSDFRNLSQSEPNLDDFGDKFVSNGRTEAESETSPLINDSSDNIQENGIKDNADDEAEDLHENFTTSPAQYQGDIENLTLVHRNNVKIRANKTTDLTDWQQKQRNAPSLDNNRLSLKPPSPRSAYSQQKLFRDYANDAHPDTELSNHRSSQHHGNTTSDHDTVSPRYNDSRHSGHSDSQHNSLSESRHSGHIDSRHNSHSESRHSIHDGHADIRHNDTRHTDRRYNHKIHDIHQRPQVVDRYSASSQMNHLSAADAIIREKNAIIEELNDKILGYEESQRKYEIKLRTSQLGHDVLPLSDGSTFLKMKDLEYDNKDLRSNMAKMELQKNSEIDSLEIKLGGVEHELTQLKEALRQTQPTTMEIQKQLQHKDKLIEELKRKTAQAKDRADKQRVKLERLESYLSDLPTLEDFTKNAEELATRNEEVKLKTEHISDLEDRLSETTQQLADSEATIHGLEGKVRQLAGKMRELSSEIHRIKTEGEGKALADTQEELVETKEVRDKVIHDLEKAKKEFGTLLETNHRKLRQMEAKHVEKVRDFQERLGQEEESVMALREEVRLKEEQVAKLKKSLKEFANKNQDLMDEALVLKEQLKQFEQTAMDETQKIQRRFVREMGICFSELQPLVQILIQQAEGREPDISLLLGTTTLLDEEGAVGGSLNNDQSLKHCFVRLRELRGEVEEVKNTICNKYAKDMGDNLKCATQ